jgi:hypothetical protein
VIVPADETFVALVGVPGRFRELLDRYGTLEQLDGALRARPAPGEWSVLELVTHVADSLHASARCAVALSDGDGIRARRPVHIDAPRAGANAAPTRAVLGALQAATADLARALSAAPLDRAGPVADPDHAPPATSGEARMLLDRALGESDRHLVDVEELLDAVLGDTAAWRCS